jgi:hypothetical protein
MENEKIYLWAMIASAETRLEVEKKIFIKLQIKSINLEKNSSILLCLLLVILMK